jgi:hypothetical protein
MITAGRLPDKPSPDDERTGIERARASVRWIAAHVPPLVEAAKQLIRERYLKPASCLVRERGAAGDVDACGGHVWAVGRPYLEVRSGRRLGLLRHPDQAGRRARNAPRTAGHKLMTSRTPLDGNPMLNADGLHRP